MARHTHTIGAWSNQDGRLSPIKKIYQKVLIEKKKKKFLKLRKILSE